MTLVFDAIKTVAIGVMAFVVCGWIYSLVRALLDSRLSSRWKAAVRNVRKARFKKRAVCEPGVIAATPVADAVPPDLAMALDRLTALHREGTLTAAEFARAKERLLGPG
ncbi:MAG TPA: SHOCT domain-containing protein [Pseudonocardiaceae bacterium]|nr:SHOCT domain-containing protein [Pseudonocardiaceae bacterium]